MRASIEPISRLPRAAVQEYLGRAGLSPEIIGWKYFDPRFAPGRERGYAWMRDGVIQGAIGLIPFTLSGPTTSTAAAWTCDWAVESHGRHPGIGIMLLKSALEAADCLLSIGGNEATRRLLPRMATRTIPEAAIELYLPLRLGGTRLFGMLARRLRLAWLHQVGEMRLPSPLLTSRAATPGTTALLKIESGVSPLLAPLLAAARAARNEGWAPEFDQDYVDWQVGRCPALVSRTCCFPADRPRAAAVYWRRRKSPGLWRMALWMRPGAGDEMRAVLAGTMQDVHRQGGRVVSTLTASADLEGHRLLEDSGFRRTADRRPLFIFGKGSGAGAAHPAAGEFQGLSYLASDLAYRLPRSFP
jgi:hypothetical protein